MRKVSKQVISAFLEGKAKCVDNTSTDGNELLLYGNRIAKKVNDEIRIYDGGHSTATTKERLNALLFLMGQSNKYSMLADCVYQRNYEWFIQFINNPRGQFVNGTVVGIAK